MTLTAGSRLGPYEIISLLGSGGMGDVYRARDTRLQRDVAVKVLTAALAGSLDALARFEREAHSVAQLSHPNILAIHDFGRDGDRAYAVTELLEGETLRARLSAGPLPLRKAVDYALQIARGLAAAHDKGIVHRDLKPENVFITTDDRVKILDFGLARPSELPSANATMSLGAVTAAGTVLGTFGYMAPEQVRAQPLDHRADLFAFGALLYEMLTGRQAFAGATPADTISAILQAEPPPVVSATGALPPALDRIVRRALEKKPELRFQSAHDLAFALDTVGAASTETAVSSIGHPTSIRSTAASRALRALPWVVAIAAAAAAGWFATRPAPASADGVVTRLDLGLPPGVELHIFGGSMAISPDGRQIAFIGVDGGVRHAYVRSLDQPAARALKGTETAFRLFFSHDGERLGVVVTDGSLRVVTLATGLVTPVLERTDFFGAAWTPNDEIVFTRDRRLWRIKAAGGPATEVPSSQAADQVVYPHPLPDGEHVLAQTLKDNVNNIVALSLSTGELTPLVANAEFPLYVTSGHLVYLRGGMLTAARFDPRTRRLAGPETPIMEGLPAAARATVVAVSASGTLVYVGSDALQSQLVWVARNGAERALTKTSRQYANPRVSADGRQILVQSAGDLWIHDGDRDTLSRLSTPDPLIGFPMWSAAPREIIFKSAAGISRLDIDGGKHAPIRGTEQNDYPSGLSPDGRSVAVTRLTSESSADIYIASLTGEHDPRLWLKTPGYDGGARWSPDGSLMAYGSTESGQMEIYLQPYPGPGVRRQVSVDGGSHPVWSRDGRELFYRASAKLYAVAVSHGPNGVALSQPTLLFDRLYGFGQGISIPNYDVSPDGRSFVFVKDAGATKLNVVLNWVAELEAKTR